MRRNKIGIVLLTISILVITLLPFCNEAVILNYTQVTITTVVKEQDGGLYTEGRLSPVYHDLFIVKDGDRFVTFSNSNSFTDLRTDVGPRRLEISISASGNELPWVEIIYTPPFNYEGEAFIEVHIPYTGDDYHDIRVMTHYRVYIIANGLLETGACIGELARVNEITNPE